MTIMYDLAALTSLAMIGTGVGMQYGLSYSLMVMGSILMVLTILASGRATK